jgi:hypothetical protein
LPRPCRIAPGSPAGPVACCPETYGAFTWYPSSDQPSDEALYDISVTVPAGWAGAANGTFTGATDAGGGRRRYAFHAAEPIASYLVTVAVDHLQRIEDPGPHGLPVAYWVRPQDATAMLPTLRRTPRLLAWLEERLGRYPFASAGVVIVQGSSGMETQTMITLGPIAGPGAVPVLLHELAHHWFGDAVTPSTWQDVWLNEGFATYLQMLYTVDQLGADADATLREWRAQDTQLREEAGPPGRYRPDRFAARNVYLGPALMLHDLRGRLGDRCSSRWSTTGPSTTGTRNRTGRRSPHGCATTPGATTSAPSSTPGSTRRPRPPSGDRPTGCQSRAPSSCSQSTNVVATVAAQSSSSSRSASCAPARNGTCISA